ncbi:tetratricopeptide repeat protein [Ravibacter arvi]
MWRKTAILPLLITSALYAVPAGAQLYSSAELDKNYEMVLKNPSVEIESTEAINSLYNFRFHDADREIRWLKFRFPRHPMPHFLLALAEWWKIVPNTDVTIYDDQMLMHLDSAISLAKNLHADHKNKIEPAFFLAASYAFKGRLHAERKQWAKATFAGKNALKYLEECKGKGELSPELLFGDGVYNYYAQWIPKEYPALKPILAFFPKGNKALGIKQLEQVATHAFYTRTEARYFLLQMYSMENQYEKAFDLARYMNKTYPDNPYFERYYCRTAYVSGKFPEAIAAAESILQKIALGKAGYEGVSGRNAAYVLAYYNYHHFKNFSAAKTYYHKAIDFSKQTGDTKAGYYISSLIGLGKIAQQEQNPEEAIAYFKEAMDVAAKKSSQYAEAREAVDNLKKERRNRRKNK